MEVVRELAGKFFISLKQCAYVVFETILFRGCK